MPKSPQLKREEALMRQESYDKLTTGQKLDILDAQFGEGKGAKAQRAKLLNPVPKRQPTQETANKPELVPTGKKTEVGLPEFSLLHRQ